MKLCFSTIGCPDWRFGDMISAAKDLGYTAIEIRGIGGEIYAPAMREFTDDFARTKDMLERTGIRIAMLTSGAALADHSAKGKSVDEAKAYIDLAAKVGAEFVRVMSTDKPYFDGGDIDLCKKQYEEVVSYAKGSGAASPRSSRPTGCLLTPRSFRASSMRSAKAAAPSGTSITPTASTTRASRRQSPTSAARSGTYT